MRRSRIWRVLASLLAIWLAVVMAEPAALHSCPVHGGAPSTASQPVGGVPAAAMAMHHHAIVPGAPSTDRHRRVCTCLGQCCAPAPVALAAAAIALDTASAPALRDSGLPEHAYLPVAAEHVLPFQNGPPAVA